MKSTWLFAMVMGFVGLALAGCGGSTDEEVDPFRDAIGEAGLLHFQADAEKPLSEGTNDLLISIREASTHTPILGAMVELSATMPAMAHDTPHAAMIEEREGGMYVARGLSLPMAGRWLVEIAASTSDTSDTVKFTYDLP